MVDAIYDAVTTRITPPFLVFGQIVRGLFFVLTGLGLGLYGLSASDGSAFATPFAQLTINDLAGAAVKGAVGCVIALGWYRWATAATKQYRAWAYGGLVIGIAGLAWYAAVL